jgi:hypothetical protein
VVCRLVLVLVLDFTAMQIEDEDDYDPFLSPPPIPAGID